MIFSTEKKKLTCKDKSHGTQSLRHIKLSATYFSQKEDRGDGLSVELSEDSGETRKT